MESLPWNQDPALGAGDAERLMGMRNSLTLMRLLLDDVLETVVLPAPVDESLRRVLTETMRLIVGLTSPDPWRT